MAPSPTCTRRSLTCPADLSCPRAAKLLFALPQNLKSKVGLQRTASRERRTPALRWSSSSEVREAEKPTRRQADGRQCDRAGPQRQHEHHGPAKAIVSSWAHVRIAFR